MPPKGLLKLNFDETLKANLGPISERGVLRNDLGKIVWIFSSSLVREINNVAELHCVLQGIIGESKQGFSTIAIKRHSYSLIQILTRMIQGMEVSKWKN